MCRAKTGVDISIGPNTGAVYSNSLSTNFDGTNDTGATAGLANLNPSGLTGFTASIWLKSTATTDTSIFGSWEYTALQRQWLIFFNTAGRLQFAYSTDGNAQSVHTANSGDVADGNWHHLVCIWRQSNSPLLYLDNVSLSYGSSGTTNVSTIANFNNPVMVGAVGVAGTVQYLNGNLDEPSMWNKALSASEVSELYNSGAPADLNSHSASANLMAWWRMGDGDTFPTISDQVNSSDITLNNMVSGDIVEDVP